MNLLERSRPYVVATVLFSNGEADIVRALLEAIAPDQGLAFLLMEDDAAIDRTEFRSRTQGASRFKCEIATANGAIEANAMYFVPRSHVRAILDGELHLHDAHLPQLTPGSLAPFITSLAGDQARNSTVIVFAGASADAQAYERELLLLAERGGLVLVQDATSGPLRRIMPTSEHVLPVVTIVPMDDVSHVLLEHAEPLIAEARPRDASHLYREVETMLPTLCELLLEATGHDFGQYKSSTLVRRTLRRLHLLHSNSAEAYLARLRVDAAEPMRLFNDLLISVTAFFRDPEAFNALSALVIPRLFEKHRHDEPVRVWVAGCATGEEAYSIAMLLREYATGKENLPAVQILATDLDEQALDVARAGRYQASRLAHVSRERVERFFTRSGASFQVTKEIRDMVLFTRHSVTHDPPFSNLDLVSCRNLLIYLGDELHNRVIPLFHYALRTGGFLFLGPAESLTTHQDLFRAVDVKHRISERVENATRVARDIRSRATSGNNVNSTALNIETKALGVMQRSLTEEFTPKGVVVTEEGQVMAVSDNLEQFFTVSAGPFSSNITRLVRSGLRVAMRSALRECVSLQRSVEHHGTSLHSDGAVRRVTITVQPLAKDNDLAGLFLVVFQVVGGPLSPNAPSTTQHAEEANALIERLEIELATTRAQLQRTVQDLEAANEELTSSNEELFSINEELQSANEELESSKEELQTTNEELEHSNNDLGNLLTGTQIPTIFLDDAGNVRRVTPTAQRIYNLRADDAGRPLDHFTHKAVYMPPLPSSADLVGATRPVEDEVEMRDGTWYTRRVLPYMTPEGAQEGIVVTFIDVSERRLLERDVQQSEARLRTVIDSMFAFVGVLDVDGTLVEINQAPLGAGRLARVDVIGRLFWECPWFSFDAEVRDRLHSSFERAAAGEIVRYDELVRTANGKHMTIDFMLQPVFVNGALQFVIPSAVDVTHRVETEELLRYQRDVTKTITDNATTAIFMTDADRLCTFANPAAELMTGYAAEELHGRTLHEMLHHTRPDRTAFAAEDCELDRALPNGREIRDLQALFVRKGGTFFPVMCSARVLRVGDRPAGLVVEVRDITAELAQSEALRQRERDLQSLTDNSPDVLTRFDRNFRHVFINAAVTQHTGLLPGDYLGKDHRELGMADHLAAEWQRAIGKVFATGEDQFVEFELETPAGKKFFDGRLVAEHGDNGEVQHALGVTRDRTAERAAERALRDANRRKDEFLATLAHELRNPLAPVRNGLEILRLQSNNDPATAEIREVMERQIVTMARLIDDLLDISRISLGKVELKRAPVNVTTIVESALEVTRPAMQLARHTVTVDIPAAPIFLDGDVTRLAQVLGNLLHNASKYTPDGGHITIAAIREDEQVAIRVSDNGIGIPEEMLTKVFDMFIQIQYADTRAQGGLGIGLALVRQLVEMHGGSVCAESDGKGKGSAFTVRLPTSDVTAECHAPFDNARDKTRDAALRILVVDDNVDAARSLETILKMMGHDARSAFSGAEAVRMVAHEAPDFVFLDIGLPDFSGYEVAMNIRRILADRAVVLVALTGWGSDDHRRRSAEAGFDHHLTKPADSATIRRILRKVEEK
jgi:two-component system CheB/CheR fusion protein